MHMDIFFSQQTFQFHEILFFPFLVHGVYG